MMRASLSSARANRASSDGLVSASRPPPSPPPQFPRISKPGNIFYSPTMADRLSVLPFASSTVPGLIARKGRLHFRRRPPPRRRRRRRPASSSSPSPRACHPAGHDACGAPAAPPSLGRYPAIMHVLVRARRRWEDAVPSDPPPAARRAPPSRSSPPLPGWNTSSMVWYLETS